MMLRTISSAVITKVPSRVAKDKSYMTESFWGLDDITKQLQES